MSSRTREVVSARCVVRERLKKMRRQIGPVSQIASTCLEEIGTFAGNALEYAC